MHRDRRAGFCDYEESVTRGSRTVQGPGNKEEEEGLPSPTPEFSPASSSQRVAREHFEGQYPQLRPCHVFRLKNTRFLQKRDRPIADKMDHCCRY